MGKEENYRKTFKVGITGEFMEQLEAEEFVGKIELRCKGWCHDKKELRCKGWCHDNTHAMDYKPQLPNAEYFN